MLSGIFLQKGDGQTFGDLPVVPIGRTQQRHFVVASEAKQSIAPLLKHGLLRFARNDGAAPSASTPGLLQPVIWCEYPR
jgi:hypothetical protein